jgi:hypothetical protein
MDSRNEWDPLEKIIVGIATHANWPMTDPVFAEEARTSLWTETPAPAGPVPDFIVDQANRELDILSETLLRYGATVYRPKPVDHRAAKGMYNYCPRDRILVYGDTMVDVNMMYPCRNQEIKSYYRLMTEARQILTMPRDAGMTLDAANICRLGDT